MTDVRCVPRRWVQPTSFRKQKVWDDSGTVGRRGSIWVTSPLQLMAVTQGHDAPSETFYELRAERRLLSMEDIAESHSSVNPLGAAAHIKDKVSEEFK